MTKVISYIDGFNLYHAIDELNREHLKWVDLWALSQSLLRPGQELVAVNYFSAYATWMAGRYKRHRTYVAALKTKGVSIHLAKFKIREQKCNTCGAAWKRREEKETDVGIAVRLVADALCDRFDLAILITADSDLKPAIAAVRADAPTKYVFVAAPPGRFGHARDLRPRLEIKPGRVGRCLLPERVLDAAGTVVATRPPNYDPPPI